MSFHKNLAKDDLHAPSILQIENAGQTAITAGEVLLVTGYNRISGRYKVRRAVELPTLALTSRALIYGIARELVPTLTDAGRMIAFGVVENLEVTESRNTSVGPVVTLAANEPVFIDIDVNSSNVGKIVTGTVGQTVEAGIVVDVVTRDAMTGTGVVTAFIFSLTAGFVDFAEKRALKTNISFDTSDTNVWVLNTAIDSLEGTIEHNLDVVDFVAQFYAYTDQVKPVDTEQGSTGGTLEVDWQTDPTDPLNKIIVSIPPFAVDMDPIVGYVEIIY